MVALPLAVIVVLNADAPVRKLTMDDCVREALGNSGQVTEAHGKVREWEGRLKEVESTFWPKLIGLGYVAPLYGLKNVQSPSYQQIPTSYQYDYGSWGPYIHLQAILAEPISTFGRYNAGKEAAEERMAVEQARYQQTRNFLALEVRKYYLLHLYAKSFLPSLELANRLLKEAQEKAQEEFETGSGSVTQVDLNKLKFGGAELAKAQVQADIGQKLALAALKHTMGWGQDAAIEVVDAALPPLPTNALETLQAYVARAAEHRPEVAQLFHGKKAAKAFELSERLSSNPTAFIAAQIDLNWTPMWPSQDNPWAYNRFNTITPGLAVGLQFDIDIAKSLAKSHGAKGLIEQVDGLEKFAATGIPMEVRKAYDDAVQAEVLAKISEDQTAAGKKWLVFAGAGFAAGTGEAKDVLEGLVAYMTAKKGFYDSLQAVHLARATLLYATGTTGVDAAAAQEQELKAPPAAAGSTAKP